MTSSFDPARPVAIIGAGVMGTKVAWACARSGLTTRLYDSEPDKTAASRERALTWGTAEDRAAADRNLRAETDLAATLRGAQLAFENVPEKLDLKRTVLAQISAGVPADAFVGSNASSLLCSALADACQRPERFFCLNFWDPRTERLVELMTCAVTLPQTAAFARTWARHIRMVPVELRKEQAGYSFNRLWRVIKKEVLRQIAEGYASPESIDRAWMLTFGTPIGPCGLMDEIGLHSVMNVEKSYHQRSGDPSDAPPAFLQDMVEHKQWGEITGRGFYRYPEPAFRAPGFLEGDADER